MFKGFVPKEGMPVQFLGVHATMWPWESGIEPTMAFTEMSAEWDKIIEALGNLYEDWVERGLSDEVFTQERMTRLMQLYDDWLDQVSVVE